MNYLPSEKEARSRQTAYEATEHWWTSRLEVLVVHWREVADRLGTSEQTSDWLSSCANDVAALIRERTRLKRIGHKYRAVPTTVHGFRFASKAEATRYQQLLLLGMAGEIRNLELQPRFDLHVEGVKVGAYVADFRYQERLFGRGVGFTGRWDDVIEDVKGVRTPVYRMKKKHFEAQYGMVIRETR